MTSSTTIKVGGVVFTGEKSVELHLNDCSAPQLREVYEDLGGDSGSSFKLPQHRSELVRMIIKLMVSQDLLEYIPSEVHHVLRSKKPEAVVQFQRLAAATRQHEASVEREFAQMGADFEAAKVARPEADFEAAKVARQAKMEADLEAELRRDLEASQARLRDLLDLRARKTLVDNAQSVTQRPGLPDPKQLFFQPVFPPAVCQAPSLRVDSSTFAALVPVTTAEGFLNALSLGCMVIGGAGLLHPPLVECRHRCRAVLTVACRTDSQEDRQYYRSLLSMLEASTGGLPPAIAEDRLCQEVVATFNREARAVVAAVSTHAQQTSLWGPAKLAASNALAAGPDAAGGAPATELYELRSSMKALIPEDTSLAGARQEARELETRRLNLDDVERNNTSVALEMHQFLCDVARARARLGQHGRDTDLTDDEYLLSFFTGHIRSGSLGSLAAKGAPLLQALLTEVTLRSPPISGEALHEFVRKICYSLDAARSLDGKPGALPPATSPSAAHQLQTVTMELQRLKAQRAESLKQSAKSAAKAKAVTWAAAATAATAPGPQSAHGLKHSARREAMKLGLCFYCGDDHIFSECTATVQKCPFCRESDHSGNDCPSLAEAKNV
jgi:hypothetical protein